MFQEKADLSPEKVVEERECPPKSPYFRFRSYRKIFPDDSICDDFELPKNSGGFVGSGGLVSWF